MRRAFRFFIVSCLCGALAACGDGSNTRPPGTAPSAENVSTQNAVGGSAPAALDRTRFGEKRIHEVHTLTITLENDDLQKRYQRDFERCLELGCEILTSNVRSDAQATLRARIAPTQLPEFLRFLATGPGQIENHGVSAEDKSIEVVDTSARLETLEALRTRLRKLLDNNPPPSIDDILKVEKELARVQGEIDTVAARKRFLEKITANATITIEYNATPDDSETDYEALRQSFRYGWQGFIASLAAAITTFGVILPWIALIFAGFVVGRFIYRRTQG